jgi:hypothetical protein
MAKATFEVQGIDKVKTMIDLLSKYKDVLPKELAESLIDAADCDACEINNEYLNSIHVRPGSVSCYADGRLVSGVISANPILRRLTVYPDRWNGKSELPESSEDVFIEAYKYPKKFSMIDESKNSLAVWV